MGTEAGDRELLDAWRDGDREAGSALFDRYFDTLARFFANKTTHGVDDLVQQTFLAAIEARDRYRGEAPFRNFLLSIAHKLLCNHYRHHRVRQVEPDFSVMTIADLDPSPSAVAAEHGEQALLLQALRAIPFESQVVLELAFWEQISVPEIAEILELPLGTAKTRVRRARQLVREQIDKLADSPELLERTTTNLEQWAAALRATLDDE